MNIDLDAKTITFEELVKMQEIIIDSDYAFDANEVVFREKNNGYICVYFEEFLEFWLFNSVERSLEVYGLELTHGKNWELGYEIRK
ncbi:hypothetical protein [Dolichospermum phage Dfl-JY23]